MTTSSVEACARNKLLLGAQTRTDLEADGLRMVPSICLCVISTVALSRSSMLMKATEADDSKTVIGFAAHGCSGGDRPSVVGRRKGFATQGRGASR